MYFCSLYSIHHQNQEFRHSKTDPDPDFPTTPFPNPEEGKTTLRLAVNLAEEVGANHVLANDPDADRLAVVEKDGYLPYFKRIFFLRKIITLTKDCCSKIWTRLASLYLRFGWANLIVLWI
jgi:phosphomannomutase